MLVVLTASVLTGYHAEPRRPPQVPRLAGGKYLCMAYICFSRKDNPHTTDVRLVKGILVWELDITLYLCVF